MKYIKTAIWWDYLEVREMIKQMVEYQLIAINKESFGVVARLQREVEDEEFEEAKKQDEKYQKIRHKELKKDKWLHCTNYQY